jgi:hypothetical protein
LSSGSCHRMQRRKLEGYLVDELHPTARLNRRPTDRGTEPTRTNIRHAVLKSCRKSRLLPRCRYRVTDASGRVLLLCLVRDASLDDVTLPSPASLTMRFRFEILSVNHGAESEPRRAVRRRRPREMRGRAGNDKGVASSGDCVNDVAVRWCHSSLLGEVVARARQHAV